MTSNIKQAVLPFMYFFAIFSSFDLILLPRHCHVTDGKPIFTVSKLRKNVAEAGNTSTIPAGGIKNSAKKAKAQKAKAKAAAAAAVKSKPVAAKKGATDSEEEDQDESDEQER